MSPHWDKRAWTDYPRNLTKNLHQTSIHSCLIIPPCSYALLPRRRMSFQCRQTSGEEDCGREEKDKEEARTLGGTCPGIYVS